MTLREIIYGVVFDNTNSSHRLIRRGIVMGLIALVAELAVGVQGSNTEYMPIIVAVLATFDKYLRENL